MSISQTKWRTVIAAFAVCASIGMLGASSDGAPSLHADEVDRGARALHPGFPPGPPTIAPESRVRGYSELGDVRDDLRVRAFLEAYGSFVDSVTYRDGDVVFALGEHAIHLQDGRMLNAKRLHRRNACAPLFYDYSLEPLTEPPPLTELRPNHCNDVQEALWGRNERQIRSHGEATRFLGRRMFLNDLVIEALARVERDILAIAPGNAEVALWIENMDITYSFINRGIAGGATRSQHSWGLAIDLVPSSYGGREVYWRWSRVYDRDGWHRIPIEKRWTPPAPVVQIFEEHGFVWGGKWAHFDNIHFEYRPEILAYNRLVAANQG